MGEVSDRHGIRRAVIITSVVMAVVLVAACALILWYRDTLQHHAADIEPRLVYDVPYPYDEPVGRGHNSYRRLLGDQQSLQLPAAQLMGIEPMDDESWIYDMLDDKALVEVAQSKYLEVVAEYPYLIPEAYDLLLEIGRRYQQRVGRTPLRVSSCLRTRSSVRALMRSNSNAVSHSCHLYGTTFDISYVYLTDDEKEALAQTLKELRDAGYLYALYEVRQPCFHVTMRRSGSPR